MEYVLRPWKMSDLESAFKNAGNIKIQQFMSDVFPDTREKWRSFIEFAINEKTVLFMAIEINGEAAGGIGVSPMTGVHRRNAEIGYWLGEKYWRQGITLSAVKEMLNLSFSKFDIDRIIATPYSGNHASCNLLEKAGFKLEAKFEKCIIKNGIIMDEYIFAVRKR